MPLSHRIIKSGQSFTEENFSVINTQLEFANRVKTRRRNSSGENLENLEEQAAIFAAKEEAFWDDLDKQKQEIIERTLQEAEKIKEEAAKKGFEEGKQSGYQEGYTTGYSEAMQQAEAEGKQMKESIQQMLNEATAYTENYYIEKQNDLLELAASMAEVIVHSTIDASSDNVLSLVKPVMDRLQREDHFITLTVRPEQGAFVKERVKELEKEQPKLRFAVLTDQTLEKNGCIVESAHNVIDLQIGKQLEAMLADMKDME